VELVEPDVVGLGAIEVLAVGVVAVVGPLVWGFVPPFAVALVVVDVCPCCDDCRC